MKTIEMVLIVLASLMGLFNLYLLGMSFYLVYVYEKNNKDTNSEEFKKVHRMWHPSMIAFGAVIVIIASVSLYFIINFAIFKQSTGKNINIKSNPKAVRRSNEMYMNNELT